MGRPAFPALSDFTADEIIRAGQSHYEKLIPIVFGAHPSFRDFAESCEILTGLKCSLGNMVVGSNFPDPERRVGEVTDNLRASGAPGMWWVGPVTKPENLGGILTKHGWKGPGPMPLMFVDLAEIAPISELEGVQVKRIRTAEELSDWRSIISAAFAIPAELARLFDLPSPEIGEFYTAYAEGVGVATSAIFFHDGLAGIYCVATLEASRGRGIGAAVTAVPLIAASEAGYRVGTLQASAMGHSVYKRLGFLDVANVDIYLFSSA